MAILSLFVLVLFLSACTMSSPAPLAASVPLPATVSGRHVQGMAVDLHTQRAIPFDTLVNTVAQADIVAISEEHYHPDIQAFALRMLQALEQRRRAQLALALEFLERDQQSAVDEYTHGAIDAETFKTRLGVSAAFMRHYFPLIDYARQQHLPVIAMNVPRHIARQVAKEGLQPTLQQLGDHERAYLPETLSAVPLSYRTYFLDAVASHHPVQGEQAERLVDASYLKDETMAAALAGFVEQHPGFSVLAIAGRFHFDYGKAIPALLQQRRPELRVIRITTMAVEADSAIDLQQLAREEIATYLWFAPPAPAQSGQRSMQLATLYR
jgi:uncharacterized iron-regulated protein